MSKRWKMLLLISGLVFLLNPLLTLASSGEATITVTAQDSGSGGLMYAIDSDAPEAFGTSNVFSVEAGSQHTIYVKDAAGNVSGQLVDAPLEDISLDVTVGASTEDAGYTYGSLYDGLLGETEYSSYITESEPAEYGAGTVDEKTVTDKNTAEKVFYTVTTKDGHVFYMVVDNGHSDGNVYLLDQVTDADLMALAADGEDAVTEQVVTEPIVLQEEPTVPVVLAQEPAKKDFTWLIILLLAALIGGVYYYLKIYIPKRDQKLDDEDLDDAEDIDHFYNPDPEDEVIFPEEEAGEDINFSEQKEEDPYYE